MSLLSHKTLESPPDILSYQVFDPIRDCILGQTGLDGSPHPQSTSTLSRDMNSGTTSGLLADDASGRRAMIVYARDTNSTNGIPDTDTAILRCEFSTREDALCHLTFTQDSTSMDQLGGLNHAKTTIESEFPDLTGVISKIQAEIDKTQEQCLADKIAGKFRQMTEDSDFADLPAFSEDCLLKVKESLQKVIFDGDKYNQFKDRAVLARGELTVPELGAFKRKGTRADTVKRAVQAFCCIMPDIAVEDLGAGNRVDRLWRLVVPLTTASFSVKTKPRATAARRSH